MQNVYTQNAFMPQQVGIQHQQHAPPLMPSLTPLMPALFDEPAEEVQRGSLAGTQQARGGRGGRVAHGYGGYPSRSSARTHQAALAAGGFAPGEPHKHFGGLDDAVADAAASIALASPPAEPVPLGLGALVPPAAIGAAIGAAAASPPPAPAAGIIFGCTNSTYDECFALSMVGLPRKYLPLVECVAKGQTLVFIFNFSDRMLHGVYIATSDGQLNLSTTAWKGAGPAHPTWASDARADEPAEEAGSPFPAQCTFDVVEPFAPIPEAEIAHVLEFTERRRFKFKLSRWQCRDLIEAMCAHEGKLRAKRLCEELRPST